MTKTLITKTLLASLLFIGVFQFSASVPASALIGTGAKEEACKGVELDNSSGANCGDKASSDTQKTLETVINIMSAVGAVIAVIVLIVNGIKLVLSSGDSGRVSTARSGIIMAVVGLLVIAVAQTLVKFIIGKVG
ncbi:MAG: hypothetical protein AAB914_00500 [Patescibacteria group bacterium]